MPAAPRTSPSPGSWSSRGGLRESVGDPSATLPWQGILDGFMKPTRSRNSLIPYASHLTGNAVDWERISLSYRQFPLHSQRLKQSDSDITCSIAFHTTGSCRHEMVMVNFLWKLKYTTTDIGGAFSQIRVAARVRYTGFPSSVFHCQKTKPVSFFWMPSGAKIISIVTKAREIG